MTCLCVAFLVHALQLNMICLCVDFLVHALLGVPELPGSLVSIISLEKFSVVTASNISCSFLSFLFFFFCSSHHVHVTPSVIAPQFLELLFHLFHSFVSLHFSWGHFYGHFFKLTDSFSTMSRLLMSPSKTFVSVNGV